MMNEFEQTLNKVNNMQQTENGETASVHEDVVRFRCGITGDKSRMEHLADEIFCVDLVFSASKMHDKYFWLFSRHAPKYRFYGKALCRVFKRKMSDFI